MQPVIIGTAGHIDHGKTALVRALTGTDTDRLKEEKERGITIELGYAFLNDRIAFIDVPGHERFIKNMVAGTSTVDFALLVVAADDGVMPQTREHFDILKLLDVKDGLIAVTKCDLVDDEWIDLVEEDLGDLTKASFLEGCPMLRVDSISGRGISELKSALVRLTEKKTERTLSDVFRLPIDRVFTIKGFGTVVTGSALSGKVSVDDRLTLQPSGVEVRVRGIESQNESLRSARAGMRVALNLSQIGVEEIERGDVLTTPRQLKPTYMLDVECHVLKTSPIPLEQRQRIRLHIGTKEVMARAVILDADRIEPGETGLAQLRLEAQTAAQRLDRFVIRRYSPQITIGGGRVLDANPFKHRKRHEAAVLGTLRRLGDDRASHSLESLIKKDTTMTFEALVAQSGLPAEQVEEAIGILNVEGKLLELEHKGKRYLCSNETYEAFVEELMSSLSGYHERYPIRAGVKKGEISNQFKKRLPEFLIKHFTALAVSGGLVKSVGGDTLSRADFNVSLSSHQLNLLKLLDNELISAGFQPPGIEDLAERSGTSSKEIKQLVELLVDQGKVLMLEGKLLFHREVVERGVALLRSKLELEDSISMSDFRVLLGTSRKFALPLLNHFDNLGYTTRRGEVRVKGPRLV